jgi:uncharacterized protein RhaS with RHS repeats
VGQFLQIDPLVPDPFTPADLNPYGYVRNDPVNGVDPTGEELISFLVALGFLAVTDAGLALGTTGVVVGTLATVGTAVGIHHATSPESYERPRDSVPPVGWLQVAEASLETAQGRSVSRDGVLTS